MRFALVKKGAFDLEGPFFSGRIAEWVRHADTGFSLEP